jgi:hypothetical protein
MRALTDFETERLKTLTENSISVTLIEPTQTGLGKSIMDATGPVRIYLKDNNIHDYSIQKQGPENKVLVESCLIKSSSIIHSTASLYRPNSKNGDPRIWFKHLVDYVRANDILGIVAFQNKLYVINITRLDIVDLLNSDYGNPLKELIREIKGIANEIADELLDKLTKIARMGVIPADLQADTAIGRTLERLLNININSSKKPDYKGIELKSYRDKKGNRKNLFAQVPDWSLSKLKSSEQILDNFGYKRGNDFKLYCTISAITRNSQGLKLKIDSNFALLIENSDKAGLGDFAIWTLDKLHERLIEKHNETFWIAANNYHEDGKEYFSYTKVQHTKKPIVSQFDILLEQGIITLDHLIKRTEIGKVVEKGPLFKIKPTAVGLLFPPSTLYNLF